MHHQNRVIRKCGVEIVFGQWMVRRKLVLVVAVADEQFSRGQPALIGGAAKFGDDLLGRLTGSNRWRGDVDLFGHGQRVDEMAMWVNETW